MKAEEIIAQAGTKMRSEQILGAVARGWCSEKNSHKTMDSDLATAIASEIERLLRTDQYPRLGCATTREMLDEIANRIEIHSDLMEYRTIDA